MAKKIVRTLYFATYDGHQTVTIDHNDVAAPFVNDITGTTELVLKKEVARIVNMDNRPAEGHPINPYMIHSLHGYSFFYTEARPDELQAVEKILYPRGWRKAK